jgi:hypothetical protein
MAKIIEGKLNAEGMKFALVVSRFNDFISEHLLGGALDALHRNGAREEDVVVYKVPGAFEIPLAAKQLALKKQFDAIICLGRSSAVRPPTSIMSAPRCPRHRQRLLGNGRAHGLRGPDHRHPGAGHRTGRLQGREQGLECGHFGHRDGRSPQKDP